ncbi:MAG: SPFH domain-containing protein [Flavobacteriaceae bacterium]|jgi:membrane protease subunit (stomatin/prohibitin family)
MAIIDVLKYEGPNDELVWKWSPKNGNQKRENQLRIGTQLVVNESQDAFMFKGGKLLDVFGAGTHTLTSYNIPFLADVIGLAFGGDTPFTAEVFYVNKALSQDAKWGLLPFNIVEPNFKVPIPITCRGSYSVKIVDSRKFLTEIVGVSSLYNQLELQKLFRGIITESTKNAIWKLSKDLGLGPLELEYMVKELSNSIQPAVKFAMSKYGLEISFFSVEGISVVDEDERVKKIVEDYHRIMSEDMEEKLRLKRRAEQLNVYKVERTFDTTEAAATNIGGSEGGDGSGASGILGTVVGLGMAMPLANQVGGMVQNQMSTGNTVSSSRPCTNCQTPLQTKDLFCGSCGTAQNIVEPKSDSTVEKKVTCDKCTVDFSPRYKFCPNCGDSYNPCPKCETDLGVNATICNACEYVLPKVCECGNEFSIESKFCSNCGKKLTE